MMDLLEQTFLLRFDTGGSSPPIEIQGQKKYGTLWVLLLFPSIGDTDFWLLLWKDLLEFEWRQCCQGVEGRVNAGPGRIHQLFGAILHEDGEHLAHQHTEGGN